MGTLNTCTAIIRWPGEVVVTMDPASTSTSAAASASATSSWPGGAGPAVTSLVADAARAPGTDGFERNTDVRDRRGVLRALRLEEREGARIVRTLKETDDAATVTSARREQKAPVRAATLERMLACLSDQHIALRRREGLGRAHETSATVTYYGTAATFWNHQEQTKIRLRIRFYVNAMSDSRIERAAVTRECGQLQIKIKTPRPREAHFVDKHVLTVPDDLLCRLVVLDPKDARFGEALAAIRDDLKLRLSGDGAPLNSARKVDAMWDQIGALAHRRPEFLRPSLVVTYSRVGYSIPEPAPRGDRPIEFQLTVDKDIRAHFPLLPRTQHEVFAVEHYFDPRARTEFARYPADVCVVEFKEDAAQARLPKERRSERHNLLLSTIVEPMRREIAWGTFRDQRGKYANFHRRVTEEHSAQKHKGEAISLSW